MPSAFAKTGDIEQWSTMFVSCFNQEISKNRVSLDVRATKENCAKSVRDKFSLPSSEVNFVVTIPKDSKAMIHLTTQSGNENETGTILYGGNCLNYEDPAVAPQAVAKNLIEELLNNPDAYESDFQCDNNPDEPNVTFGFVGLAGHCERVCGNGEVLVREVNPKKGAINGYSCRNCSDFIKKEFSYRDEKFRSEMALKYSYTNLESNDCLDVNHCNQYQKFVGGKCLFSCGEGKSHNPKTLICERDSETCEKDRKQRADLAQIDIDTVNRTLSNISRVDGCSSQQIGQFFQQMRNSYLLSLGQEIERCHKTPRTESYAYQTFSQHSAIQIRGQQLRSDVSRQCGDTVVREIERLIENDFVIPKW